MRFAAFVIAGTILAQQSPTIKVPVRLIAVPTLVFSGHGKLVSGLDQRDFKVYDNGHIQSFQIETDTSAYAIAVVIQTSQSARAYLPFVSKVGSVLENSLQGQTGRLAIVAYDEDVTILKPFGSGDAESAMHRIVAGGEKARLFDAALNAIDLLRKQPAPFSKVLLMIGQPYDSGSSSKLTQVLESAGRDGVSIFTLTLPFFGKNFISDTFSLQGLSDQFYKGGYMASVELTKLGPALKQSGKTNGGRDPFSLLAAQTGGIAIHFRKQNELENTLIALGGALHSTYVLSYSPQTLTGGHHSIRVKVDEPGAIAHAREGYESPDAE